MKLWLLNDIHKILYKVSVCALGFVFFNVNFVAADPNSKPQPGEIFTLNAGLNMPLPAIVIKSYGDSEDPALEGSVTAEIDENIFYQDGAKFHFTGAYGLGKYGNDSFLPIVFVNPIKANGEVDTSSEIGLPAHFLKYQNTNQIVYDNVPLKKDFTEDYKNTVIQFPTGNATTNFEQEKSKLNTYLVYISGLHQASTPTIYPSIQAESSSAAPSSIPPEDQNGSLSGGTDADADVSVSTSGSVSGQKFRDDPRYANVVEVFAADNIAIAIVEVIKSGKSSYVRRGVSLEEGQRFIPVPMQTPKTEKGTATLLRAFYKLNTDGSIALNDQNQPEVFFLPSKQLIYVPEGSQDFKPVQDTTPLINIKTQSAASTQPKPAPAVISGETAEIAADTIAAINRTKNPTTGVDTPVAVPAATSVTTNPAAAPLQNNLSGTKNKDLWECRNPRFGAQLASAGEECKLVPVDTFELVKSSWLHQLKGPAKDQSIIMKSGLIAINNSSKMCSRVDVTIDEYLDDSNVQSKINEYKQNMDKAYRKLLQEIHNIKNGIIDSPLNSIQSFNNKHSFSCESNSNSCKLNFAGDRERLPLLTTISNYADNSLNQESTIVYGPSKDNKYLFVFKIGNQIVRSLVLQDNPIGFVPGRVGRKIFEMQNFNKKFKFHRLSDIQTSYNSNYLRDAKQGHFINIETASPKGQTSLQSALLGSKEGVDLIKQIQKNNSFFKLECKHYTQQSTYIAPPATADPTNGAR